MIGLLFLSDLPALFQVIETFNGIKKSHEIGNVLRSFPEPTAFEGTSQVGLYIINYIIRICQEKQKKVHPGMI
ncbi:hypothetical protein EO95_06415 [Methanosarcina sp. 1.H.T.1A.1]|nr:hypothetical protein EO95_06415 [Methanosarcina sp. 1.H.T.1A.1]